MTLWPVTVGSDSGTLPGGPVGRGSRVGRGGALTGGAVRCAAAGGPAAPPGFWHHQQKLPRPQCRWGTQRPRSHPGCSSCCGDKPDHQNTGLEKPPAREGRQVNGSFVLPDRGQPPRERMDNGYQLHELHMILPKEAARIHSAPHNKSHHLFLLAGRLWRKMSLVNVVVHNTRNNHHALE